jgi:UDP-N-acetylglucosamine 1-carboxyvinyltransferase
MGEYHVTGGKRLSGEIKVGGAKNAVLPILAATVLNRGQSVIYNCPFIKDTFVALEILEALGCKTRIEKNVVIIDSKNFDDYKVPFNLLKEMRSSIIFLGGVLGAYGKAKVSFPGGCELGARPIDIHLDALRKLGVAITEKDGYILCEADVIKGCEIIFKFPSVGATENVMLAAVLGEGETNIINAAREPEITDLQNFLNAMGAKIKGAGTSRIVIEGLGKKGALRETDYKIMPDRIVAATYLIAAAVTKGDLVINNVKYEDMYPVLSKLNEVGCLFKIERDRISMKSPAKPKAVDRIITEPHPGFPTDCQPQFSAALSVCEGTSIVTERVFESRNKHIGELIKMGADIILSRDGMNSIISGVKKLKGADVESKDLRGGAALIIAGLAAEGKTIVKNSCYVQRGYEKIEEALSSLGADIKLVD